MPISTPAKIKARKRAALHRGEPAIGRAAEPIFVPIAPVRDRPVRPHLDIGPDTRDLTGRIMGDPLPGRSALNHRSTQ